MPRTRSLLLALCLSLSPLAAKAENNFNYLGQTLTVVTPSANAATSSAAGIAATFTNAVTQQTGRQSCWIQYRPFTGLPVNSATNQGAVFFGVTQPTTLTTSFILNAYGILNCEQANEVEGGGIWVSGSAPAISSSSR